MPTPRNKVSLAAELFVAQLALDVITEEVDQGVSFPGAMRPLFTHEVKAHTRFGDLDNATKAAQRAIRSVTDPLWSGLAEALMRDLLDHSDTAAELARRLGDIKAGQAVLPGTASAIADAQSKIYRAILQARLDWANHTLDEALAQGVDPTTLPETNHLKPTAVEAENLGQRAREVAQHPLTRAVEVASQVLGSRDLTQVDPAQAMDDMRAAITGTSHDGTDDIARQAVTDGGNMGRAAVVAEAPKPKYVYASELLDGKTCDPCARRDGHHYDGVTDAAVDYPNGGGYVNCLGGRRCRGTLVYVWPEEAAPTLDAPDVPPPLTPEPQLPQRSPAPEHQTPVITGTRTWTPLDRESIDARSDGTPIGDRVAARTQQLYESEGHEVVIEANLTEVQTHALLGDVHNALSRFTAQDTRPVSFKVPVFDKTFHVRANGGGGVVLGYVRRGDDTVFINPVVAAGTYVSDGGGFMAAAQGVSTREYTITHELGHVLDAAHDDTALPITLANKPDEFEFFLSQRGGLSRYGRSDLQEGYAEAFSQWKIGGPGASAVADAYAERYGWK